MPDEDPVEVMGLRFPNTIGLAAGMDKDGIRVNAFGALGFGHVEIGTITPLAQPGNPKPRCFRVIPAKGIINRMGFNNEGCDKVIENLRSADAFRLRGGILGINIGKNAVTPIENALSDYEKVPRQGLRPRRLHRRQHLLAQHEESSPASGRRQSSTILFPAS